MKKDRYYAASKLLARALRHEPAALGLTLDANGYAPVDDVLRGLARRGRRLSPEELVRLVADNDKQRFAFDERGAAIRASQGHSIDVELGYSPLEPPSVLYHGTADRFLASIEALGLEKRQRRHVHLSANRDVAHLVGARHGRPVVLAVDAASMFRDGHTFYVSANGVWLTEHVPPAYLRVSAPFSQRAALGDR